MNVRVTAASLTLIPSVAFAYSAKDAEHVLGKGRPASETAYVVCLEKPMRGATDLQVSLDRAAKVCAAKAPRGARAGEIRSQILECGFRKGDASPDAGC